MTLETHVPAQSVVAGVMSNERHVHVCPARERNQAAKHVLHTLRRIVATCSDAQASTLAGVVRHSTGEK